MEGTYEDAVFAIFDRVQRRKDVLYISQFLLFELLSSLRIRAVREGRKTGRERELLERAHNRFREVFWALFEYENTEFGPHVAKIDINRLTILMDGIPPGNVNQLGPLNDPVTHFDLLLVYDSYMAGCDAFYTYDTAVLGLSDKMLHGDMVIARPPGS